jgi:hypothetical protein
MVVENELQECCIEDTLQRSQEKRVPGGEKRASGVEKPVAPAPAGEKTMEQTINGTGEQSNRSLEQ